MAPTGAGLMELLYHNMDTTEIVACCMYVAVSVILVITDWFWVASSRKPRQRGYLSNFPSDNLGEIHLLFFIFCLAISGTNAIMLVAEQYDLSLYTSTIVVIIELACISDKLKRT